MLHFRSEVSSENGILVVVTVVSYAKYKTVTRIRSDEGLFVLLEKRSPNSQSKILAKV